MNHVIITTNVANTWESDEFNKQGEFTERSEFLFVLFFRARFVRSVCSEYFVASQYAA
jgi:hypothetical protein